MSGFVNFLKGLFGRRPTLTCVWASETGAHRSENQDSVFADAAVGVFAVADGMGGAAQGAVASQIVCRWLGSVDWKPLDFEGRVAAVDGALRAANAEILEYVRSHGLSRMGTTAAVLVVDVTDRSRASVTYIGDSRVYRVRGLRATSLTTDHTIGRELGMYAREGRNGAEGGAPRNAARLNHVLTRAIGIDAAVALETIPVSMEPGDRYVVCSDGVHDVLSSEKLASLVSEGPLDEVRAHLRAAVEAGGSPDNYSFVLIHFGASA